MKKRQKSNMGVMVIAISIVLLGILGYYLLKENKLNQNANQGNDTNLKFNEVEEKEKLDQNIKEIDNGLGLIAILTSIDKYNAGGDYITKKNINLLQDTKDKQLFVMEQLVSNQDNYQDFIILNMNNEVEKEKISPTTDATTAYYPYDLFEKEYNKYFDDKFDLNKRKVSNLETIYDNDQNYIYYENRRAGINGLSLKEITIEKITKTSSNQYKANITLHYNQRLSELLGVNDEKGELVYTKNNDNIKLISFLLK